MRRIHKISMIALAAIAVLAIIGYIIIRSFLTTERVRRIAQQVATEALQYPVEIGGTRLNVGFRISIGIADMTIVNPEGFRDRPMLEIEKTALNIKLLPLLRRKVVIGSIDVTRAILNVEKNREGEMNIAVLIPKDVKGPGWNVSLSKVRVRNSEFHYYDAPTKREYRLSDIDQDIGFRNNAISVAGSQRVSVPETDLLPALGITISNSVTYDTLSKDVVINNLTADIPHVTVRVSGTIDKGKDLKLAGDISAKDLAKLRELLPDRYRMRKLGGRLKTNFSVLGTTSEPRIKGTCSMEGLVIMTEEMERAVENVNATFSFDRTSLNDIDMQGNLGNTKFQIEGAVSALNTREPMFDISATVEGDLRDFESLTAEMKGVKLKGAISGKIALKGSMKKPRFSGDVNIRSAEIDGIGLAKPLSDLNIRGTMQHDALRINECGGRIGKSDLSLTGTVSNFSKPIIRLNNRSKLIDLDEMLPKGEPGRSSSGKGMGVTIHGTVTIAKLVGMGMEFTNVNSDFDYVDGIVDLKDCRAQAYGGQVAFDFYYNANSPEPYRIDARMTGVQAQKITQRFLKFDRLKGSLSGVVDMSGTGLDKRSVQSNTSGVGNLRVVNGEFDNFAFLVKLLSWMGLQGQNTVRFSNFDSGFRIANGRATVDDWTISSQTGDFLTRGSIGLNGTVDLQIAITLSQQNSAKVKRYHGDWIFFTDKDGRTVIDVLATGGFDEPRFRLDTERIKERIGGKIKNEFKEKTKDFESKIKDILKGIK